jgi:predicted ArsR family transcriptional regulator
MTNRSGDRLLYALKAQGPQTAARLAARLMVTPVAVRQLLARLLDQDLVGFEDRRETVGRPKRCWHLTDAGHARFPDNHAGLTAELLAAIPALFGAEGLERLIAHREAAMLAQYRKATASAATLAERARRLARLRSAEGYMAEIKRESRDSLLLIENHCPICVAAKQCQGFCRSELSLFRSVLGPDVSVERLEHIVHGARRCVYRIAPRRPEASRARQAKALR